MTALTWQELPASTLATDADLRQHWDRLNSQRGDLPFLGADAMTLALEVFGQSRERLFVGSRSGAVSAMVIAHDIGKLRWETFQPSQIPLGAWVAASDLTAEEVARSALHDGPLKLSLSLSLTQVDPLFAPQQEDAGDSRHDAYIDTAWVDVQGSFDDYWAARGKNLRQNMRKQRNKLQAEGIQVAMRTWQDAADMPALIARYGALEGRSWKAQEGTAITPDNDQGRFYTALLQQAAGRGEAVVYEGLFDAQTVAVNLCVRRGTTLTILKTTYDESIKAYSPAFLLHEDIVQAIFTAGDIRRIEYYGKVMEWHTRWTDNRRTLYHLTMFRNSIVKRLAQTLSARNDSPTGD